MRLLKLSALLFLLAAFSATSTRAAFFIGQFGRSTVQTFVGTGNPNTNRFATNGAIGSFFLGLEDTNAPLLWVKSSTNGFVLFPALAPLTNAAGDFHVSGNLTVDGNTLHSGTVTNEGDSWVHALTVDGIADLQSDIHAGADIIVHDNIRVGGELRVTNAANFFGDAHFKGGQTLGDDSALTGVGTLNSSNIVVSP
jgi:hypothetical protein